MSTVVSVAAVRLHRGTTGNVVCSNISALCMATAVVGVAVGGVASQHRVYVAAVVVHWRHVAVRQHGDIVNVKFRAVQAQRRD